METTLTAMLFSGGRAALAHIGDSRASVRGCSRDHRRAHDQQPRRRRLLLAPVLARHLDGRPGRSADTGLRDLRAGGRYLLCPDGLSPVVDDRPHFYVLTLRAASADAPANWPS